MKEMTVLDKEFKERLERELHKRGVERALFRSIGEAVAAALGRDANLIAMVEARRMDSGRPYRDYPLTRQA